MITVPIPQANVRYFKPDGTMTPEGIQFFDLLARAIRELQSGG